MGDFNFPSIVWSDGSGQLNPCPAYSTELNSLFLDVINDAGFEQLVTSPTRNDHVLDLVFQLIKTHDSESRGQEEAGRTRRTSELFTCSTTLNL